ncbi:MAG: hypothetical protein C0521_10470 [Xanthomonas sp.]|nr:hypothetical protein [Xanthomonas sp.]
MRPIPTFILMMIATPVASAQSPAVPAPVCLDARQVAELQQASPRQLAALDRSGQRFRIDLGEDCPGSAGAKAQLLARGGRVCGHADEAVRIGAATCPIIGVAPVGARDYAMLARAAASLANETGPTTLDAVEVRGERRRGFGGSSSYCFDTRYLRSWSEDGKGMLVEVAPKRSGGHRYYRVELPQSCPDLNAAPAISFRSGVGISLICGNPGDRVVAEGQGESVAFGVVNPVFPISDDVRQSRFRAGMRFQCTVSAVYPHESEDGNGQAPR